MASSFGRNRYRRPEEAGNASAKTVLEEIFENEEAFRLSCTEAGDERAELARHGPNHSPDNIFIHPLTGDDHRTNKELLIQMNPN